MCFFSIIFKVAVRMSSSDEGYVVRVRGLPWSCTQEEVASFFSGEKIHVENTMLNSPPPPQVGLSFNI